MAIVIEKGKVLLKSVGGNKTMLDKYMRYALNEKHKCPKCKKSFPNSVDNCKKCGMDLLDPELFLKSIRV